MAFEIFENLFLSAMLDFFEQFHPNPTLNSVIYGRHLIYLGESPPGRRSWVVSGGRRVFSPTRPPDQALGEKTALCHGEVVVRAAGRRRRQAHGDEGRTNSKHGRRPKSSTKMNITKDAWWEMDGWIFVIW